MDWRLRRWRLWFLALMTSTPSYWLHLTNLTQPESLPSGLCRKLTIQRSEAVCQNFQVAPSVTGRLPSSTGLFYRWTPNMWLFATRYWTRTCHSQEGTVSPPPTPPRPASPRPASPRPASPRPASSPNRNVIVKSAWTPKQTAIGDRTRGPLFA